MMKYEITHRWTGDVLFSLECDTCKSCLEAAAREGATLVGANLHGANLRGANLRGANLRDANLEGADLRHANLEGANFRDANLREANLGAAKLEGANLGGANLEGADLDGANLRAANLGGANLRSANLGEAIQALHIPHDPTLPRRILDQITRHPETWDQSIWHHPCGTAHCVAGWATTLSGPLGHFLDHHWGTATAATLLLWREGLPLPSFEAHADKGAVIAALTALAERAEREARHAD